MKFKNINFEITPVKSLQQIYMENKKSNPVFKTENESNSADG